MRISEVIGESALQQIHEDISRRGFFGGLLGAGALGAAGVAGYNAVKGSQPSLPTDAETNRETQKFQQQSAARSKELERQGVEPKQFSPKQYRDYLIQVAKQRGITTDAALAGLLGQVEVETDHWQYAAENMNYNDPDRIRRVFTSKIPTVDTAKRFIGKPVELANYAYAGRNGNGDVNSGDGWRYRGRGFIQITGRELYAKAGRAIHPENPDIYVNNPTILSTNPREAALTSVWYYLTKVGTKRTGQAVTKRVNPAGLKSDERRVAMAKIQKQLQKQRQGGKS